MNYNLYKKGTDFSQVWITETFDERMRWYTGQRIKKKEWSGERGRGTIHSSLNAELEKIESIYNEIKKQLKIQNKLTAYNVKFLLDCESIHKAENYIDEIKDWIPRIELKQGFLEAFQLFIDHSLNGERTTKKGKKINKFTVKKYKVTLNLLDRFAKKTKYPLTWANINDTFYIKFTNYCWYTLNHYDNMVGTSMSNICAFLNWAVEKQIIQDKKYNPKWIIWKENETDALVLFPDEVQALY